MAPVGEGLELWATVRDLPQELTVISFSALFIFLILLILCTTCGRQSFELKDTTRTEKPSSQLVRVIKLEDSGSRINPDLKRIMDDEKDNTPRITNQRKPIDFGIEEIFNCSDTAEKQISASQRNSIEMDDLNQITVNVMSDIELEKYPEEGGENLHALYATVSKKSKALPKQETSTEEPDCHPPEEEEPAPPVPEKRFDI
nr:PREDICTED: uncharacterized protein LOC107077020 isoform X2 [Lepisosteus oculatus]